MKLNWFSPLPPARTDIGHYTARILPALSRCSEVTLWSDQEGWDADLERYAKVRAYHPERLNWRELNRADITFYNIGNNAEFHLNIWRASQRFPGVVVLHDVRVQEFFAYVYRWIHGDLEKYLNQLERYDGPASRGDGQAWWHDQRSMTYMVEMYPMTPWALDGAFGAFIHTQQAFEEVTKVTCRPVGCAPLPYACTQGTTAPRNREQHYQHPPYRLIIFGYIHKNRRLEPFLNALSQMPERQKFRLQIYGQLWDASYVQHKVEALGLGDLVTIHGFVPEPELDIALNQAHLAINLRYPTMGEASGSQLRIWSHALPTLVTKIGMYESLSEDTVAFVRPDQEVADIQAQLRAFLRDPSRFRRMGEAGLSVLATDHSPENYAHSIIQFARSALAARLSLTACNLADFAGSTMERWITGSPDYQVIQPVAKQIHEMLL